MLPTFSLVNFFSQWQSCHTTSFFYNVEGFCLFLVWCCERNKTYCSTTRNNIDTHSGEIATFTERSETHDTAFTQAVLVLGGWMPLTNRTEQQTGSYAFGYDDSVRISSISNVSNITTQQLRKYF